MYLRGLLAIGFSIILIGCADTGMLTKDVKPIVSDNYVIWKEDQSYQVKRGIGVLWTEGLKKGVYKPELENEMGTYYRGPESCVTQFMGEGSMGPFEGGVWIPKDRINRKPRIYYYFNFNQETVNKVSPLVGLMLAGSVGDITFVPKVEEKTFLDSINVTNLPLSP